MEEMLKTKDQKSESKLKEKEEEIEKLKQDI